MDEVIQARFRKRTASLALRCAFLNNIPVTVLALLAWAGSFSGFDTFVIALLTISPFVLAVSVFIAFSVTTLKVPEWTAVCGGILGMMVGAFLTAMLTNGMNLGIAWGLALWTVLTTSIGLIPAILAKFVYRWEVEVEESSDE